MYACLVCGKFFQVRSPFRAWRGQVTGGSALFKWGSFMSEYASDGIPTVLHVWAVFCHASLFFWAQPWAISRFLSPQPALCLAPSIQRAGPWTKHTRIHTCSGSWSPHVYQNPGWQGRWHWVGLAGGFCNGATHVKAKDMIRWHNQHHAKQASFLPHKRRCTACQTCTRWWIGRWRTFSTSSTRHTLVSSRGGKGALKGARRLSHGATCHCIIESHCMHAQHTLRRGRDLSLGHGRDLGSGAGRLRVHAGPGGAEQHEAQ